MGEAETIIGVVAFVVIFVTVSYCWVRTHESCFKNIENGRQHALSNQEHMADAHEHKEQRNHERDLARQKRAWDREDHEHERSKRTSARTQPQNEHHDAVTHESVRQHKRDQDHHAAPVVHESGAFGFGHTPHAASVVHESGGFSHIPAQARTVYGASPHPTVFGSIHPSHTSAPHQVPHNAATWGHPIPTLHPPVPHGGSFSVPHGWVRVRTELRD